MDHQYIRDNNVVSLYLLRQLSVEECNRFEEHFVDCQQCLDQLQQTDDFRGLLQQVTKQDLGWSRVAPQPGPWFGGLGFWPPKLLAGAGLLVALSLAAVFLAGTRYRRSELAESRNLSDDWQRRYVQERQTRENLEKQMQGAFDKTGGQPPLMAGLEPAPLFFLTATRGADLGNSPSTNRVAVPAKSTWIVLSVEFEPDPGFQSYRARLSNLEGRVVWSAQQIVPPPSDAIAVSLPSRLLSKGDYWLVLDGLTSAGRYVPAAHFSFRATEQKQDRTTPLR
jgi:hypothetical protein